VKSPNAHSSVGGGGRHQPSNACFSHQGNHGGFAPTKNETALLQDGLWDGNRDILGDRAEFLVLKLWLETQAAASVVEEVGE